MDAADHYQIAWFNRWGPQKQRGKRGRGQEEARRITNDWIMETLGDSFI
jgi:hypothetical protein